MASGAIDQRRESENAFRFDLDRAGPTLKTVLRPLASLYLTVVLMFLAIFLVFVGTLAQDELDISDVLRDYFYAWVATIKVDDFLPQGFVPHDDPVPGKFWFPGGAAIGLAMFMNLLAAHAVRFTVQAKGVRLGLGVITALLGIGVTWLVIEAGHRGEGIQGTLPFDPSLLWNGMLAALVIAAAVMVFMFLKAVFSRGEGDGTYGQTVALRGLVATCVVVAAVGMYTLDPEASASRILWQLIQGTIAAVVLLLGCWLLFKKRAGIALLHGGVGLLMFGEFFVSMYAVEQRMTITEGETVNYTRDIRTVELAVLDPSDEDENKVTVVPEWMLKQSAEDDAVISHEELPFDVQVLSYMTNAELSDREKDEKTRATDGAGLLYKAKEVRGSTGSDTSGEVDLAAAYVALFDKETNEKLGVWLVSQILAEQNILEDVKHDDTAYQVGLRFKRIYKPYMMHLVDVRKDDYPGTSVPRNYSSDVRLLDKTRNIDRDVHIWMNNPLRYAGETFYQSGYNVDRKTGTEITDLQIVQNTGWMIPYVSCMLVTVGMLFHFSGTLVRFLNRRAQGRLATSAYVAPSPLSTKASSGGDGDSDDESELPPKPKPAAPPLTMADRIAPLVVAVLAALMLVSMIIPPKSEPNEMDLYGFSQLPVQYEGRVKPLDTLARNTLRIISDRETLKDGDGERQPAIRWLLDVMANTPQAEKHEVFRIANLEVLETLDLEPRRGWFRYSVDDLLHDEGEHFKDFQEQVKAAREMDEANLTFYQKKLVELDNRIRRFTLVRESMRPYDIPEVPSEEDFKKDREKTAQTMMEIKSILEAAPMMEQELVRSQPPQVVPPSEEHVEKLGNRKWLIMSTAWIEAYKQKVFQQEPWAATVAIKKMLDAYADGNVRKFNAELAAYNNWLAENRPLEYDRQRVSWEAWYNHAGLFLFCKIMYIVAFVLAVLSWLFWTRPLNRSATALIALTFLVHTLALVARIYFSGRPPVTNLYSSAVFIGWGCVLFGLLLEWLYRLGVGNVLAAACGFAGLLIAYFLAADGDTMKVLQAVLDTNFWLATHVVCITLGYATTFVAGALGLLYILMGVLTPALRPAMAKDLGRMIYGVVCFSIFFSFVGTVLGGLWADDSWGRFWGWDPKENGALMIVLWNALVLHARWGGMVKDRGLAALAVAGNVVTAWSWFGVNQLGIGLHSYGFQEGMLLALISFAISQLVFIGLACLPNEFWWSHRANRALR